MWCVKTSVIPLVIRVLEHLRYHFRNSRYCAGPSGRAFELEGVTEHWRIFFAPHDHILHSVINIPSQLRYLINWLLGVCNNLCASPSLIGAFYSEVHSSHLVFHDLSSTAAYIMLLICECGLINRSWMGFNQRQAFVFGWQQKFIPDFLPYYCNRPSRSHMR